MFALPDSKRVRRNELDSPSSSRASSPDADILAKLQSSIQFSIVDHTEVTAANNTKDEDDDDVELAFNLFAPIATTSGSTQDLTAGAVHQTVRIRSPTPLEDQIPGFITANRPDTYYFTGPLDPIKAAEYAEVAVSGTTIQDVWSKRPCPGCAYPWKVISIPSTSVKAGSERTNAAEESFLPDEAREKKRKRLGKNARVKKRVKAEKSRAKKEEAEKGKEEKERLEREKRARRNREKKFKKRARDKAKKANGGVGDAGGDGPDSEGEASDGDEGDSN